MLFIYHYMFVIRLSKVLSVGQEMLPKNLSRYV